MTDAPAVVPPLPPRRKTSVPPSLASDAPPSPTAHSTPAASPVPVPVVSLRPGSPSLAHRSATSSSPLAQAGLSFLTDLHAARGWDAARFAAETATLFPRTEEALSEASEAVVARAMAAAGAVSCGDLASQQRIVEAAADTFDALALVPGLFRRLPGGAAAAELAAWAAETHAADISQRLFFGARSDAAPDIYTLVTEHFLERAAGPFVERLLSPAAGSAAEVWEAVLQRLLEAAEVPQALLFVARRLERPGPLAGLVLGSLLGPALARRAQAAEEPARAALLGARQLALGLAAELSPAPAPAQSVLGRSGGALLRVRASVGLRRVEEGLRSSAGKIEAVLHRPREAAARKSAPETLSDAAPAPIPAPAPTAADAEGDAVLREAGVSESMTHDEVRQLGLSEAQERRVVAELLRRPVSRLCADAMRVLEADGLRFAEMRVLPLLPARPPGVANRTLYKNYARLKFEYGQRANLDQSAEQLVEDIFSFNDE